MDLEKTFTYHKPDEFQMVKYGEIRQFAKKFGQMLIEYCPESREKSVALTKLQEVVMWANAAIAINTDK